MLSENICQAKFSALAALWNWPQDVIVSFISILRILQMNPNNPSLDQGTSEWFGRKYLPSLAIRTPAHMHTMDGSMYGVYMYIYIKHTV